MQNIHPVKIAYHVRHKIVKKLADLSVKMTILDHQKDKIIMKVAHLGVTKLHISFKDIKSPGRLPISL